MRALLPMLVLGLLAPAARPDVLTVGAGGTHPGIQPAGGELLLAGLAPSLGPSLLGVTVFTQVMVQDGGGQLVLGNQATLVVLDSSL